MVAASPLWAKDVWALLTRTWSEYQRHNAQWLAAALAYFAAFAVAPLIVVFVEIAGFAVHGHQRVLNLIFAYIDRGAGSGSLALRQIVASSLSRPRNGVLAQIVGWSVLFLAALGLFSAAQFVLNAIWESAPKKGTLLTTMRERAWSFVVLILIALLLLVSVGVETAVTALAAYLVPVSAAFATLMKAVDSIASFVVVWAGFALLFICLPDAHPTWRDVRLGAAITAFLFVAGQFFVAWYLGTAGLSSTYGAFGSLVAFMLWVNYSAQILLFGAEFTRVYAQRFGSKTQTAGEPVAPSA